MYVFFRLKLVKFKPLLQVLLFKIKSVTTKIILQYMYMIIELCYKFLLSECLTRKNNIALLFDQLTNDNITAVKPLKRYALVLQSISQSYHNQDAS